MVMVLGDTQQRGDQQSEDAGTGRSSAAGWASTAGDDGPCKQAQAEDQDDGGSSHGRSSNKMMKTLKPMKKPITTKSIRVQVIAAPDCGRCGRA
jgi:hypothetical protein